MEEKIAAVYQKAKRFDEGEIVLEQEYKDAIRRQRALADQMEATFGERATVILDDYTFALYEEMELEAQHFFQEGYRMAMEAKGDGGSLLS